MAFASWWDLSYLDVVGCVLFLTIQAAMGSEISVKFDDVAAAGGLVEAVDILGNYCG
jgi:hypothetical protein